MMRDATTAPQSAIRARGITRDFTAGQSTIRVLHGIDTDIHAGEMTYVVGESGSGKTTLISIMCGILWPTEGEVKVFGTDIYKLSDTDLVNFRLTGNADRLQTLKATTITVNNHIVDRFKINSHR